MNKHFKLLFLDHINQTGMVGREFEGNVEDPNFEPKHVILYNDYRAFWINMNRSYVWEACLLRCGMLVPLHWFQMLKKSRYSSSLTWKRTSKIHSYKADEIMVKLEKIL